MDRDQNEKRVPKGFRAEPFAYHEEIEFQVDSLSNLGLGVGRYVLKEEKTNGSQEDETQSEESRNWVVFVVGALPGEWVRGRVWKNESNCSYVDLIEVKEPSEQRVEPRCRLFSQCGGCQYQHLAYEEQLLWKQKQVSELLKHMTKIEVEVLPTIASPQEWGYRSKITPHFHKAKKGASGKDFIGAIGFLVAGTRSRLIDVPECPIAMPCINEALPQVRKETQQSASQFKKGATLLLRASACGRVETSPQAVVEERVGNLTFQFLAGDFFQNNPFILEDLVTYVGEKASAGGSRFLVDAYCGSGLFALSLADRFEQVLGVEVSETSIDWAKHNARINEIEQVQFFGASAEAIFQEVDFSEKETSVIVDPPRKGCGSEFLEQLFMFQPKRVIYVSCNPATQIRDLNSFLAQGYQLKEVQPFDLFPQTRHLECVMVLEHGMV